jgi:hypothetical protein
VLAAVADWRLRALARWLHFKRMTLYQYISLIAEIHSSPGSSPDPGITVRTPTAIVFPATGPAALGRRVGVFLVAFLLRGLHNDIMLQPPTVAPPLGGPMP